MTETEARSHALRLLAFYDSSKSMRMTWLEKRYLEVVEAADGQPGPVRDVLAWMARFEADHEERLLTVAFSFDDETGEVLRA